MRLVYLLLPPATRGGLWNNIFRAVRLCWTHLEHYQRNLSTDDGISRQSLKFLRLPPTASLSWTLNGIWRKRRFIYLSLTSSKPLWRDSTWPTAIQLPFPLTRPQSCLQPCIRKQRRRSWKWWGTLESVQVHLGLSTKDSETWHPIWRCQPYFVNQRFNFWFVRKKVDLIIFFDLI